MQKTDPVGMTQYNTFHLISPASYDYHKPFVIFSLEIQFDTVHTAGLMGRVLIVRMGFSENMR